MLTSGSGRNSKYVDADHANSKAVSSHRTDGHTADGKGIEDAEVLKGSVRPLGASSPSAPEGKGDSEPKENEDDPRPLLESL